MKTTAASKVTIKVSSSQEQQENVKNCRKTLKTLQESAVDKENLIGRSRIGLKLAGDDSQDTKRKKLVHKAVQTGESQITVADLTSEEEPSSDYWKLLAEKRGDALNDSLQENDRLKEHIDALEEENRICKEMLEESKNLVEVLQEIIEEPNTTTEIAEEASENQ